MPKATRPYHIITKVSDNAYVVDMEEDSGVHNTFNTGNLTPYHDDTNLRTIYFKEGGIEPSTTMCFTEQSSKMLNIDQRTNTNLKTNIGEVDQHKSGMDYQRRA